MNNQETFRIVTRGSDGKIRIRDYLSKEPLLKMHDQIGVEDCSTNLSLRGLPVFRGLIGPMSDGKNTIRYESPEVFEALTKEWGETKTTRKPRRRTRKASTTVRKTSETQTQIADESHNVIAPPKLPGLHTVSTFGIQQPQAQ